MRVAFDTAPLLRPYPPGVRRACRGLVEALERSARIEVVRMAPAEGEGERAWRHLRLPRSIAEEGCAGLHSPVSAFPVCGVGRRVQTVHELPWRNGVRENADLRHRFWAAIGPARADAVLCPTEFVARDLRQECRYTGERIAVCAWGIEGQERSLETNSDDHGRPTELEYVLALGAVREKKNLIALVRALALGRELGRNDVAVVVTGAPSADLDADLDAAERLGVRDLVQPLGLLPESELPALIRGALCVPVLSPSEGFGFPVLEAMAQGTPAVVPARSAQAEVAGRHAITVERDGPGEILGAFERARTFTESTRAKLRRHAESFTWERCARQVEALWMRWA